MEVEDSSETVRKFTRRALYDILKEFKGKKMEEKFSLMEEKLKWTASSYKDQRFLNNNEQWLTSSIKLPYWSAEPTQKPGRPTKTFEESSDRSKRRKTKELREQLPVEELTYAAGMSQRTSENSDASKLIKEMTSTPTRATKFRKVISSADKQIVVRKHTPEEALAIFVEGDFSRRQWEVIHGANKSIYPCYSLLKKAKNQCYPNAQSIRVTETCSEVELQALLDHTALRLYKYVAEVIETCSHEEKQNMVLISKWGCDGAQQSQYKQKFENNTVPLRLVIMIDGD
ncbi:unnamed protein product [Euphydryas editha]|uniref:Uncharacterized protein n=1 Tax=Euphydryas editha TaxID=104508 RepID=A0AAU9VCS8_EUPED|nr:unnamed protein product [Euphydryas editha]